MHTMISKAIIICGLLLLLMLNFVQSAANIGDIRLLDATSSQDSSGTTKVSGLLQVYFTDGSAPLSWSYVCTATFYLDEGKTACQQLGYEGLYNNASSSVTVSDPTTHDPVWLTDVKCSTDTPPHLFHCKHTFKTNDSECRGEYQHQNKVINITCGNPLRKPLYPYSGQVALCPPDSFQNQDYPTQSVSVGIVSLYLYRRWEALLFEERDSMPLVQEITHYRGNLICKQMGFQQVVAGSIQTLGAYKAAGYTFDHCLIPEAGFYLRNSWITTQNITCHARNYLDEECSTTDDDPCFSCCYNLPLEKYARPAIPHDYYVVLQCMYDAYTEKKVEDYKVPFGNKLKCSFPTGDNVEGRPIINKNSVCAAKVSKKPDPTVIAFAVLFFLSFIVVFVVFTSCCCYRYRKNRAKVKTSKETSKETSNEETPLVPHASNN